jgi:hypothetical protein
MNTIADLRHELFGVFNALKSGEIAPKIASEMNNSAGKIINTAKVQLDYYALRKELPNMPFLNLPVTQTESSTVKSTKSKG